jgi:hypothetical protein
MRPESLSVHSMKFRDQSHRGSVAMKAKAVQDTFQ